MNNEIKTSNLVKDGNLSRISDYFVFFDDADETQADTGSTKRAPISAIDASVWSVSANYNIQKILPVYNSVNGLSANWNSNYSQTNNLSANWNSVYTSVLATSARWNASQSVVTATSGNWNSNYTSVNSNSSHWNSVFTYVNGTSANNASNYTSVNSNSSNWNSSYTKVNTTSAQWTSAYNAVHDLSGGTTGQILAKVNNTDGRYAWRNKRIVYSFSTLSATQNVNFNALSADHFIVPLSSNGAVVSAIFVAPTNPYDGQMLMWDVRHATSNTFVSLCSHFRLPTSSLLWTNSGNKMDVMAAKYNLLDNKWDVVSFLPGFSF